MTEKELKNWSSYKFELTANIVDQIIETSYTNSFKNTKIKIKELILKYGRNQDIRYFFNMIVKEDFIEQYYISRENYEFVPSIDFSKLPDIIHGKYEKVTIIYLDKICGIEIGKYETNFENLINKKIDIISLNIFSGLLKTEENAQLTKDFIEEVTKHNLNFELNEVRVSSYTNPVKIRCNKCDSSFWILPSDFLKKLYCPKCLILKTVNEITKSFEDFVKDANKVHNNQYDYSLAKNIFQKRSGPKIPIKCKNCGTIFYQTPKEHLVSTKPCPTCRKEYFGSLRKKNSGDIKNRLEEIMGPDYLIISEINGSSKPIKIKELSSNIIFSRVPRRIFEGGPIRPKVYPGEKLTSDWLKLKNISFKKGVKIVDKIEGRTKNIVIIDFIANFNNIEFWIEVNGQQHYLEKSHNSFMSRSNGERENRIRYTFQQQISRDKNIRKYCKENNIMFIEIPYTYFSYKKIDDILTRIILNGESPDFIKIPEITYIEPNNKPENYDNV